MSAASALALSPGAVFVPMLPSALACVVYLMAVCVWLGRRERARLAALGATIADEAAALETGEAAADRGFSSSSQSEERDDRPIRGLGGQKQCRRGVERACDGRQPAYRDVAAAGLELDQKSG